MQSGDLDIISDIPRNLIETILMCLPLKDAGRTSILSTKWRYSWINIPKLVFDENICRQGSTENELLRTIYQVMLVHSGAIHDFTLSSNALTHSYMIDQLLLFLSRIDMEKLKVNVKTGQGYYKLPSSFFSYSHLTHLDLAKCVFQPPPTFEGFSKVTSITFKDMVIDDKVLERFISSCLHLESLTLASNLPFRFEIDAPKLKILSCSGKLKYIRFKNTPLLLAVSLSPMEKMLPSEQGESSTLLEFSNSLPSIENLEIHYYFYLELITVPKKLPTSLIYLKILKLTYVDLEMRVELSFILCLLRSFPNLKKLTIEMSGLKGTDTELSEIEDMSDVTLDKLQEVNIKAVSGTPCEMEFIKVVLSKAHKLQSMLIEPLSEQVDERLQLLKTLIRFKRASTIAEIIYID